MTRTRPPHNIHRTGFTLMELLLALVLTSMIMSAAFGAVHLSWKYRSAGDVQVEQSQTIRGIIQDITLDLRSTAIPNLHVTTDEQAGRIDGVPESVAILFREIVRKEGALAPGPNIQERVLNFDSVATVDPIHFYGESDFMVMLSTSPNYRFTSSIQPDEAPGSHVVWSGSKNGSLRIPFAIKNDRLDYSTVPRTTDQTGLSRMQRQLPSAAWMPQTDMKFASIVPDAIKVSFRYSNGNEWRTTWNSHQSKQLPTAIELNFLRESTPLPHRFVIRLPQANEIRQAGR